VTGTTTADDTGDISVDISGDISHGTSDVVDAFADSRELFETLVRFLDGRPQLA